MNFSQGDLNKVFAHIPVQTLRNWAAQEIIESVKRPLDKRGITRIYSFDSLIQTRIIETLSGVGLKMEVIAWAMKHMLKVEADISDDAWTSGKFHDLVSQGKSLFIRFEFSNGEISRDYRVAQAPGPGAIHSELLVTVNLKAIAAWVKHRVRELKLEEDEE